MIAAPSTFTAIGAVAKLSLKRLVRGNKVRLGAVAVALVLVGTLITRYSAALQRPADVMRSAIELGFFKLLVYLIPFLFLSGAIAEEVENRTFPFLASRPISRFALGIGKYLAGTGAAIALLAAGVLLLHIGCYATLPSEMIAELPTTLQQLGALVLLAAFYGALCMCMGTVLPEAAGIASILYLATIELAMSFAPYVFRFVSMNYLATQIAGITKDDWFSDTVPHVIPLVAVGVIAGFTALLLLFSALVVQRSEFRFGNA